MTMKRKGTKVEQKKVVRNGLEYCGGRAWRCVKCDNYVQADCECCEPPACNCQKGA